MRVLKGIPVSPGIVIGRVFVLDDEHLRIPRRSVPGKQVERERRRLEGAMNASVKELEALRAKTEEQLGEEAAKIFAFHIGMLADPTLRDPMFELIERERVTAEYAVWDGFQKVAARFSGMNDQAFRTKVEDVRDLSVRVLRHLIGEHRTRLAELDRSAVVVARDLTPSQAAGLERGQVVAFATEFGGRTSHTAIFARALGIPAVVGCDRIIDHSLDGMKVIIDGDHGVVVLDPTEDQVREYQGYIEQRRTYRLSLTDLKDLPSETRDGTPIELLGNIEFPEEVGAVLESGGAGIGLYRTEYLYLTSDHEPTEEEHFAAYRTAIEHLDGRILTIRTVDLGADKHIGHRPEIPERNPFLGLRSIRYCLRSIQMFKTQLRAILRASALGPVKVMFPLVTSVTEFRRARYLLNDVMEDLQEEGVEYDAGMPVGMMVEVPAAALMADSFAREVDFFSIGTNDLVQYTLAVDRTNERVADLFNPAHPAVIKLIKDVVRVSRRRGVPLSCCGESAGDLEYAMLLIGLGVRTISATPSSLPALRRLIRSVKVSQCERLAKRACSLDSDAAVTAYLRDQARRILPEAFDGRAAEY